MTKKEIIVALEKSNSWREFSGIVEMNDLWNVLVKEEHEDYDSGKVKELEDKVLRLVESNRKLRSEIKQLKESKE